MASDTTGLLIVRTWIEPGSSEPLRAQLRLSTDISAGIENTVMLARTDDVCAAVQAWLADVLSRQNEWTEPVVVTAD